LSAGASGSRARRLGRRSFAVAAVLAALTASAVMHFIGPPGSRLERRAHALARYLASPDLSTRVAAAPRLNSAEEAYPGRSLYSAMTPSEQRSALRAAGDCLDHGDSNQRLRVLRAVALYIRGDAHDLAPQIAACLEDDEPRTRREVELAIVAAGNPGAAGPPLRRALATEPDWALRLSYAWALVNLGLGPVGAEHLVPSPDWGKGLGPREAVASIRARLDSPDKAERDRASGALRLIDELDGSGAAEPPPPSAHPGDAKHQG
jgi:hypothetical protein